MNHPNRNPNRASASPTPAQLIAARTAAGMTPAQAGALIYERATRWEAFEAGTARMHAASWELWRYKVEDQTS